MNIFGVEISDKKVLLFALTSIYGIGKKKSNKICEISNLNKHKKVSELLDFEIEILKKNIKNNLIENDLKIKNKEYFQKKINLNNYKSLRYKKQLPCRGQRTKTNAKTTKKIKNEFF